MTDSPTASAPAATPKAPNWRRLCLRALPVVLPLALAVQGRTSFTAWLADSELWEQRSALDTPATLGGAEWRIVSLQRVAERPDGSAVALLRLEAKVLDAERVAQPPCRIALLGPDGRRWQPSFLLPSEARRVLRRDKDESKTCGPAFLDKPAAGSTVAITESFVLPGSAFPTADVTISLPGSRPRYLRFLRS
jgi:hypothetical protein